MREMITTPSASPEQSEGRTRALLLAGAVAGPLYLVVGLIEAFTRPGFDIRRHDLSLLANGDLGWIHMTDLIVSGLLVVAGAVKAGYDLTLWGWARHLGLTSRNRTRPPSAAITAASEESP